MARSKLNAPEIVDGEEPSLEEYLRLIGSRIRELRELQGLPMTALGEFTGITPGELHRIETGKRNLTVRTADRIAKAIGVHTYELFIPRERSSVRVKPKGRRKKAGDAP